MTKPIIIILFNSPPKSLFKYFVHRSSLIPCIFSKFLILPQSFLILPRHPLISPHPISIELLKASMLPIPPIPAITDRIIFPREPNDPSITSAIMSEVAFFDGSVFLNYSHQAWRVLLVIVLANEDIGMLYMLAVVWLVFFWVRTGFQ